MRQIEPIDEIFKSWRRCVANGLSSSILAPKLCLGDNEFKHLVNENSEFIITFNEAIKGIKHFLESDHLFLYLRKQMVLF